MKRRDFITVVASAAPAIALPERAYQQGLNITERLSPRAATRPNRESTRYIILHTTEANGESSLNSITGRGSANYVVNTDGSVYRIMREYQVSHGAGRSMWNGLTDLNDHAVNIEFVGYASQRLTDAQFANGRRLIEQLQNRYRVPDRDVVTHAQVAYGNPNRWYSRRHRGRKWDARRLARGPERERIGLYDRWEADPDVRAGRLLLGPRELADILYGTGPVEMPDSVRERVAPIIAAESAPEPVFATVERGQTVWRFTGDEFADPSTVYFLPDGRVRRGDELRREGFDFNVVQSGTRLAVGYVYGGHVKNDRSAISIAGRAWRSPSTIYRFPDGTIVNGDEIDPARIPAQTIILFQR